MSNLHQLTELEKFTSGVFFLNPNNEIELEEIRVRLKLIKFSQNEINKYQEYIQTRKTYLESHLPAAVVAIITDKHLAPPALSAPKYNPYNPVGWQKNYAAFFRLMTGEQEEAAIAKHNSKLIITSPAPRLS